MPPVSDKELEERLTAAGNSLLQPPSSLDELLPLLDQIEKLLSKVEQSPTESMQTALSPLMKALVADELLKHSDAEVQVGVASCINEITRITAPDAPYDDDRMKDVCQLIVSSFENLSDTSSRSYEKRATILETVAKVRFCVIMLDLECDQMIIEMFQHFLKARGDHVEAIFASMVTIMTLVLEESEDVSPDLLNPILATLKVNNEAVMPNAKKLAERVIQSSGDKLRPYLAQAVKSLDASFDDFGEVVASLCREHSDTVGNSNESISRSQLVVERRPTSTSPARDQVTQVVERKPTSASPARNQVTQVAKYGEEAANYQEIVHPTLIGLSKSIVSNGMEEACTEEIMTDANFSKEADSNHEVNAKLMSKSESDDSGAQNVEAKAESSEAQEVANNHENLSKDVPTSPTEVESVEADEPLEKVEDTTTQLSESQAVGNETANVASPTQIGSLRKESRSKKGSQAKKKEKLVREQIVFVHTASKKASEGKSILKAKKQRQSGKRQLDETTNKDKASTEEGASKNDEGSTSDSEARSLDQMEKLGNTSSKTEDGSSMTKEDGKKGGRVNHTAGKNTLKSSAREVHVEDTVTSPNSLSKSMKDEDIKEETPSMSTKRKRTPGSEKASDNVKYGKSLVGAKIKVWWPDDMMFYAGIIASFDPVKKKHKVAYTDGDEEVLNLRNEQWEFVADDMFSDGDDVKHSSHDTASDVPMKKKKKGNTNSETSKGKRQRMVNSSPKSKLKDTATKSGGKSDDKPESEAKDKKSKPIRKTGDDSQEHGGKSQASGGRSKDDSAKTPSHPTQDSQRNATKSKGKTSESEKTLASMKKTSSSSKVKETDRKKEKTPTDLAKSSEMVKGKSPDTSKSRGSESKSGKKRRR